MAWNIDSPGLEKEQPKEKICKYCKYYIKRNRFTQHLYRNHYDYECENNKVDSFVHGCCECNHFSPDKDFCCILWEAKINEQT